MAAWEPDYEVNGWRKISIDSCPHRLPVDLPPSSFENASTTPGVKINNPTVPQSPVIPQTIAIESRFAARLEPKRTGYFSTLRGA